VETRTQTKKKEQNSEPDSSRCLFEKKRLVYFKFITEGHKKILLRELTKY
jgi:hypothetical protein